MDRTKPQRIGDLFSAFIKDHSLERGFAESHALNTWYQVVGPQAGEATDRITLSKGVLTVSFTSAVVRNELFMRRGEIRRAINDRVGREVILRIVIR